MDLVYNAPDLKLYERSKNVPESDQPLLVYIGRIKRYKGIDITIKAFSRALERIPGARLVIVGRGDDRVRLEALVRSLGLEKSVSFSGYVTEDEKILWLRRAHALIYPSPREGWGIATMEAAACGTPVLASDSEGLREAVRNGVTGFLIPHRDIAGWADRMVQIVSSVPLRQRMGNASQEWARRFDWDVEAEKMRQVIEMVVMGSPSKRSAA
jgi:glycosyltransferase involved in cell wall biosynthesis